MLQSQKEILEKLKGDYFGIGITQSGEPYGPLAVPWESMANAFNMKTPQVYLSPEDIKDPEILEILKNSQVVGCYIFDALEDYSFISPFTELHDVFIMNGGGITDISFMKDLKEWFMFYIEDAKLSNLEPLFPTKEKIASIFPYCIGFGGCEIDDISVLENPEIYLSELVVICPKGTNERERWQNIRCGTYGYYEYESRA